MIELRKITWDNYDGVIALKTSDAQKGFVWSNEYTLVECYVGQINNEIPPLTAYITELKRRNYILQ